MTDVFFELEAHTDTAEAAARVSEVLARTMLGLTLDGIPCRLSASPAVVVDEAVEEQADDEGAPS